MSTFVESYNTGRGRFQHRYSLGTTTGEEQVSFEATVSTREEWIRYMFNLNFAALDGMSPGAITTDQQRAWMRSSAVGLCLQANETGWGEAQWWGNCAGFACSATVPFCMRFSQGDPTLRAFVASAAEATATGDARVAAASSANLRGVESFWRTIREGSRYRAFWPLYQAGRLVAVQKTEQAGWRSGGEFMESSDLTSIYRRVYDTLTAEGQPATFRQWLLTPAQASEGMLDASAPPSSTEDAPSSTRRSSKAGWVLGGIALAALALAGRKK